MLNSIFQSIEFVLVNYTRYSHASTDSLVIDTGFDNGTTHELGYMHDYVGICLTSDYPHKLYHFNPRSLGKKMLRFVQNDPRKADDYFAHLIKTQVNPDESYYPNVGYHEFSVFNSDCLDPLYVAPFDWDL